MLNYITDFVVYLYLNQAYGKENMTDIIKVKQATADDSKTIESLAKVIWNQHYTPIIGQHNVDHMLSQFQTADAILKELENGFVYYIAYYDDQPCGYTAIKPGKSAFLGKLYLKQELRGKGIGKAMFNEAEAFAKKHGAQTIKLKCYKHNPTLDVYYNLGFRVAENVISDFGNGCLMDDFVMEKSLVTKDKISLRVETVFSSTHIEAVESLAKTIWNQHYTPIIGQSQVDYMLEKYQSKAAVKNDIKNGYTYYIAYLDNEPQGYCAVKMDDGVFLSKFYVIDEARGKGIGKSLLGYVKDYGNQHGAKRIWLTCNKGNPTLDIYKNLGYEVTKSIVTDIGNGYVMDDYVLQKKL